MAETVPSVGAAYKNNTTGLLVTLFAVNGSKVTYVPQRNQGSKFPSGREFRTTLEDFLTNFTNLSLSANPANTVVPTITGVPKVGVVLSSTDGTWTGSPTPTLTRQWKAAGVAIVGATNDFYIPVVGDVGKAITLTVTGTNIGGTASATSVATANVAA
jgi:hypothetical protein